MKDKRTLVNVKLRAGRTTRELAQILALLAAFAGFLGVLAGIKVFFCKRDHPDRAWTACLRPPTWKGKR